MSISVGGLISSLDTNSIIDQLLGVQQEPIVQLQQEEAAYQVELTAYGSLRSVLNSLNSAAEGLDAASDMTSFSAVSGDTDLFTVSADENAATGSYDITIQQLAKANKLTSTAFSDSEAVGEGTLHLKVGSATATDIEVSATDTIDDVAQAINDADAGVQAAVIFDGTDYFLTLTADETGADHVITLTVTDTGDAVDTDTNGLSRLVFDPGVTENLSNTQSAADAVITVDGVADIHRATNVIDDVIEGVTMTLESAPAAPDNQTTLTVSRNTAPVTSAITAFVTAYNEVLDFFETYQGYNAASESGGVLMGDATTNGIRNQLDTLVTGTVTGIDSFERLSDLGISVNDEDRLEIDSATLESALDDEFDDLIEFFTRSTDGSEGFAVRLTDALDAVLDSDEGTLAARTDGIQNSIDDIEDQVERVQMRIDAWEVRTRAQFNALEVLLAEYQTTGDYLSQQIVAMQNFNSYVSNK